MDLSESAVAERWVKWCRSHEFVKCIEFDVPDGVLPAGFKGTLIDVKVQGKRKFGPDDKIYSRHADLREKVARGNCVLRLQKNDTTPLTTEYMFLIFALRKFSGGLGDEDDNETQNMWQNYFRKPVSEARKVVCTVKANGEAAHISCRRIANQNYFVFGSKNVHLIAKNNDDVQRYSDSRFLVARSVGNSFYSSSMESMDPVKVAEFIEFMQSTRYTAVAEILQPNYQHVVNLSYLKSPEIQFICFTEPFSESECNNLCAMAPNQAIDTARSFGLSTIDYSIIDAEEADNEMLKIRSGFGYEGKVLYYLDENDNVFGIIKKKTAWYIILRSIREKAATFTSPKCSQSLTEMKAKVGKRIKEIQVWLSLSNEYSQVWTELGSTFIQFVVTLVKTKPSRNISVRSNFPALWMEFLESNESQRTIYDNTFMPT